MNFRIVITGSADTKEEAETIASAALGAAKGASASGFLGPRVRGKLQTRETISTPVVLEPVGVGENL